MARLDHDKLARAVARHLGESTSIEGLRRLSGGASRETWAFDVVGGTGPPQALVLRRDPSSQVLGSERATEYELIRAAQAAGVPVPTVRFLLDERDDIGAGFVMDRIDGETIPRKILRDDAYATARAGLARRCGEIAAGIHAIDVATLPELPTHELPVEIAQYRALLDNFVEPHPAFELALTWLEAHAPPPPSTPRLVHGDFRNGNFIVGPDGLRSVLDWELAHLGDPIEDLGWLCVKSWRFGNVEHPVGGFGSIDDMLAGYRAGGGSDVDPDHLRYWEAFGTLKWGVICIVQCFTHLNGLVRSVELATLGRRVAETEWDLLDLLHPSPARFDGSVTPAATEPSNLAEGRRGVQDRPTAAELAAAIREFLEGDVMDAVEGRVAFHTRVAVNALGMLEREARFGPELDAAETRRLTELLGHSGDLDGLTRELAAEIRSGRLDDRRDRVVDVVRESVAAKLAVANPGYVAD